MIIKIVISAVLALSILASASTPTDAGPPVWMGVVMMIGRTPSSLLVDAALGKKPYKQTAADKRAEKFFAEKDRWSY